MIALPEDKSCGYARPRASDESLPRSLDVDILQRRVLDIGEGFLCKGGRGKDGAMILVDVFVLSLATRSGVAL